MRSAMILLPFLIFLGATCCHAADAPKKPTESRSYVMVTEGIVGGFVPAHVRQRIVIIDSGEDLALLVMKQPVRNVEATYHKAALPKMEYLALMKKLAEHGLWKLPVEVPAGCQDIYN